MPSSEPSSYGRSRLAGDLEASRRPVGKLAAMLKGQSDFKRSIIILLRFGRVLYPAVGSCPGGAHRRLLEERSAGGVQDASPEKLIDRRRPLRLGLPSGIGQLQEKE